MEIQQCSSADCSRPFEVREIGGQMPGTKEPEDISCPYCGHTTRRTSNGSFMTTKMSPDAEREWSSGRSSKDQSSSRG